jgi:hypothetical protein
VTANLESTKYHSTYGNTPQTSYFPDVISGGNPAVSTLYNPSGLVGYWPMNEGTGSSTIDQSGNGNNGTWSGTPIGGNGSYYTGGIVGNYAGDFDGNSDYITLGTSTNLQPSSLTIAMWVDNKLVGSSPTLLSNSGTNTGFILQILSSGLPRFLIGNGSNFSNTRGNTVISNNVWWFVVATYTSGVGSVYEDGTLTATSTQYAPSYSGVGPAFISSSASSTAVNGYMDDVRLYSRALSPAEVIALYNAEK